MTYDRITVSFLRTWHLLSISAWIGGGIGIMLLLVLDYRTKTASELQAFNLVIDAVDDCIIAPGAISTLLSGLLLAHVRRLPVLGSGFFGIKLYCTAAAILYGLLFVAPCLEKLRIYSQLDNNAVFDDRLYAKVFLAGTIGCAAQSIVVLALLIFSVLRPRILPRNRQGGAAIDLRSAA